ncbi:hypothetical protein theurythT_31540 [Thalassotalea eurytherma]|uniref:Lipoprotein n=2 Tax=Thalassotalea eurytherma TaxID=1144278 RepID=A0ABQ6H9X0_9GAMM|nr:hypothetical protein theurythT_31540 [Thalassotalea eurytherma]
MKKIMLFALMLMLVQGCTLVGIAMDKKFPPKYPDDRETSFSDMGVKADIDIAKSVITGDPLPGNEPKERTGCEELKGKDKKECLDIAEQLTNTINKHTKK